ncbi:hypothetical protein L6V77_23985 [Myxococcota bacterium]|nr:hypothetical protein [Myxococcota bacterium]
MSLRTGYASGAHVHASFGDFGTFRESSGAFQLGVGIPPPPRLRLWAGAAGERTPGRVRGHDPGRRGEEHAEPLARRAYRFGALRRSLLAAAVQRLAGLRWPPKLAWAAAWPAVIYAAALLGG